MAGQKILLIAVHMVRYYIGGRKEHFVPLTRKYSDVLHL